MAALHRLVRRQTDYLVSILLVGRPGYPTLRGRQEEALPLQCLLVAQRLPSTSESARDDCGLHGNSPNTRGIWINSLMNAGDWISSEASSERSPDAPPDFMPGSWQLSLLLARFCMLRYPFRRKRGQKIHVL